MLKFKQFLQEAAPGSPEAHKHLKKMKDKQLERHLDLIQQQIKTAHAQKNTEALTRLQGMESDVIHARASKLHEENLDDLTEGKSIWQYNKTTGLWRHQRDVTPETEHQWMDIFKKDHPNEHFHVSKHEPKHNPTKKMEEFQQLDELSKETLRSYIRKSSEDVAKERKNLSYYTKRSTKFGAAGKLATDAAERKQKLVSKRDQGINTAVKKLKQKLHEEQFLDEMSGANWKTRDLLHHIKKHGWNYSRSNGQHDIYTHPKSQQHLSIPRHKQLKAPLVLDILKKSVVAEDTLIESKIGNLVKHLEGSHVMGDPFSYHDAKAALSGARKKDVGAVKHALKNYRVTVSQDEKGIRVHHPERGDHYLEEETIQERTLSAAETNKKEEIVKSMKKKGDFSKYGDRAKEVMYATATKAAKRVAEETTPRWKYHDATGVERQGHLQHVHQGQGSDITYQFKRDDGKTDMVSGERLKKMQRLEEGRRAMPLKGHDYHYKSDAQLHYIIKDAGEAAHNMKGFDHKAEGKYLDQVNDAHTVLHYRRQGGKQLERPKTHTEEIHPMKSFKTFLNESFVSEELHAYKVHKGSKHIDTVFYGHHVHPDEVKRSLVNHDGYDSDIRVTKERKKKQMKEESVYEEIVEEGMKKKYYVGVKKGGGREVFTHHETPTQDSHGHLYNAVIGPHKTKAGAETMTKAGGNNPHIQHVNDAEKIAKKNKGMKEEVISEKNWIQGAIKHKGALTRKAKRAGESPMEFAHEHEHDSGTTGSQSRLAVTLSHMRKKK